MTSNHARLHQKPFLTPIWLMALGSWMVIAFLGVEAWVWITADSTTVIVVRHAEKELDAGEDPPLTPAGIARADLLARLFGDRTSPGHLDAIYVSPTRRSHMTAEPLASRLGIKPVEGPQHEASALARRVIHEHSGGRVLVVGHGDTVPAIVEALSGVKDLPPIADTEYGTMYIVTVPRIGRADFLRLNY